MVPIEEFAKNGEAKLPLAINNYHLTGFLAVHLTKQVVTHDSAFAQILTTGASPLLLWQER